MILTSPFRREHDKRWRVFCAGPIQGAPDWQNNLPDLDNILWVSPRRKEGHSGEFSWSEQVEWEHDHLLSSDIILMWIPEETEHVPGRSYAQTSRTEFGEYLARGKKVVCGCWSEFPGRRYLEKKLQDYGMSPMKDTLEECIEEIKEYIGMCEASPKVFFTSDTHFGSSRTLELSKRPFKSVPDMDWTLIQKWNDKVHPCDTVYHLGDFGDTWPMKYLNGNIYFVEGNYEREGKSNVPSDIVKNYGDHFFLTLNDKEYLLVHEPLHSNKVFWESSVRKCPVLFGHIHGRQKIKKFGIDVGTDAWNYTPISEEEVRFYLEAIQKGYYDEEVWS